MRTPTGLAEGPVYLDYNATTPIDPAVVEATRAYLDVEFGNPSSDHSYGTQPRLALSRVRDQIRTLIGAVDGRIVFTGSGSEANNLAIRGAVLAAGHERPHIITQATEHPAVLQACTALRRWHSADVTVVPVGSDGLVDPDEVTAATTRATVLVSIMAANNETGALQPIGEISSRTRERGVLLHCDAAQAIGKIPFNVANSGIDLLTVVGHKMYAPKGIAALYTRNGVALEPLVYGGGQEFGLRAGTESVASAVALGEAARRATEELAEGGHDRIRQLRDGLHRRLTAALPDQVLLNGPATARLPNTLNVSIRDIPGHALLAAAPSIAASTGSACHGRSYEPSPVLTAMGLSTQRGLSAVRLSLGRWSTADDIELAADSITAAALERY